MFLLSFARNILRFEPKIHINNIHVEVLPGLLDGNFAWSLCLQRNLSPPSACNSITSFKLWLHYTSHLTCSQTKPCEITSSSSSKEATRFSAAFAKCSILGSSSFLIPTSCSSAVDGMVI